MPNPACVAMPLALAKEFRRFSNGQFFMVTDWLMAAAVGLPSIVFCWSALRAAAVIRQHQRRAFLSALAVLLPIAAVVAAMAWRSRYHRGIEIAVVILAASAPLVILSLVVSRRPFSNGAHA
jgi:hypothetical protein